jgi:hypothetical protein
MMFILAAGGQTYSRLSFNVGPAGSLELPVSVDYSLPFGAADHEVWTQEYEANVRVGHDPFYRDTPSVLEPPPWDGLEPPPEDDWFDQCYACVDHESSEPDFGGYADA